MKDLKSSFSSLRLFFTGFLMGSADLVPGVSGGTVAFVLGIYETLISSIKTISTDTLRFFFKGHIKEMFKSIPFAFLVPLMLGIFSAIFSLSKVIDYLLHDHPVYIWSFFFGLVVASILIVRKEVKVWNQHAYIAFTISTVVTYFVVGLVPVETPHSLPYFFISGAIAICAMILPGISGSFILVMMGKYQQVLTAVNNRDFLTLMIFMAGAVIGLAIFSQILNWLFKHYHNILIASLTGIMMGSLRKVWPWKIPIVMGEDRHGEMITLVEKNILPSDLDGTVLIAVALAIVAILFMFYVDKLQTKA